MGTKRKLKELKADMTAAKKAWKEEEDNKTLKKAFKRSRKLYREALEEEKKSDASDDKPAEKSCLKTLKKEMLSAKKQWKKKESDKTLKKEFKRAKKLYMEAKALQQNENPGGLEEKNDKDLENSKESTSNPEVTDQKGNNVPADTDVSKDNHESNERGINSNLAGTSNSGSNRVFVANLSYSIDEETLRSVFKSVQGDIVSIKWGEDKSTGEFKGYAHVDFSSPSAAADALVLSGTEVLGREMRLELSENNGPASKQSSACYAPSHPTQPVANPENVDRCFVGNLNWKIDKETLLSAFESIGIKAEHVFWVTDKQTGDFYGSSFVTFQSGADAAMAVAYSDAGLQILKRPVKIQFSPHKNGVKTVENRKQPLRETSARPEGGTKTAFFGNLSFNLEEEQLRQFCEPAKIKEIRWLYHKDSGNFKGAGFAEFTEASEVDEVIKKNGMNLVGRPVRIDYA